MTMVSVPCDEESRRQVIYALRKKKHERVSMTEKQEPTTREMLVAFAIGLPLGIGASLVRAWCIVTAWTIALVPLGAPRVDLLAAMAVHMVYDTQRALTQKSRGENTVGYDPVKSTVTNAVSRAVGWLVFLGFVWLYAAVLR